MLHDDVDPHEDSRASVSITPSDKELLDSARHLVESVWKSNQTADLHQLVEEISDVIGHHTHAINREELASAVSDLKPTQDAQLPAERLFRMRARRNHDAFHAEEAELLRSHKGCYVAYSGGKRILVGEDEDAVDEKAREIVGEALLFVYQILPASERPVVRLRNPWGPSGRVRVTQQE